MMYRVKEIIEPDFGCEGLPDGQEPCCEVLLEDMDSGACRTVKIPDAELYRQVITEGCVVTYDDGVVKKATAAEKMLDGGWQAMYQAAKNVLKDKCPNMCWRAALRRQSCPHPAKSTQGSAWILVVRLASVPNGTQFSVC